MKFQQFERYIIFTFRSHEQDGGLGDHETSVDTEEELKAYCEYLDKIKVQYQWLDCDRRFACVDPREDM